MCMICVDEVVIATGAVIAAAPFYKSVWRQVKCCIENLRRIS